MTVILYFKCNTKLMVIVQVHFRIGKYILLENNLLDILAQTMIACLIQHSHFIF